MIVIYILTHVQTTTGLTFVQIGLSETHRKTLASYTVLA